MAVISRRMIIDMLKSIFNTDNVVLFDEFESQMARHICPGARVITLLRLMNREIMLPDGSCITISYFYCPVCGKLYLDKNSLIVDNPSLSSTYSDFMY